MLKQPCIATQYLLTLNTS